MTLAISRVDQGPAIPRRERGLTFIEILVVLAIMGLAAAIALPTFMRSQVQAQADREMRSIRALFDFARSEAIKNHGPVTITADADGNGSISAGEREIVVRDAANVVLRRYSLRSRFQMDNTPNSETSVAGFVYAADGSLVGGTGSDALYFSDRRGNFFRLFVTRFMGSPRAEKWTGSFWSPRRGDWEWK